MLRHNEKATLIAGTFFRNVSAFTLASGIKAACIRQSLAVLQENSLRTFFYMKKCRKYCKL